MPCCNNCFNSQYLNDVIIGIATMSGQCDYCNSRDVKLVEPRLLFQFFKNILDLYQVDVDGNLIASCLQNDFPDKLFKIKDPDKISLLIYEIASEEIENYKKLFNNKISLSHSKLPEDKIPGKNLNLHWDKFSNEIKKINRFHIKNSIDLSLLQKLLNRHSYLLKKGTLFYRGRISLHDGFNPDEMFNPPSHLASAGRANPNGISYLYLANDVETTLYETRSSLYDYVTIGKFLAKSDLNLINLKETNIYDPIPLSEKEELNEFLLYLPFINTLEVELSKPIRRYDSDLDYLPTQYICEFIKSSNFDGVVYKSSLNPMGYNIAIFNSDKFDCIGCEIHEINAIKYTHKAL